MGDRASGVDGVGDCKVIAQIKICISPEIRINYARTRKINQLSY